MSKTVPPMKGKQAAVREDYFQHDAGFFALDCNPGFGKSTTLNQIAAEALVRADAAGDRCPEQQLCVISFSREDAASIEPGIRDALDAFAEDTDGAYPVQISPETADRLKRRLQMTDHIGTIDSVLRGIFEDIASELGFDGMPSVGNASQLSLLRQNCIASVRQDDAYSDQCTRLDTAYPTAADSDDESDDRLHTLLEDARAKKRDRRLSIDDFEARLRDTVTDVYPSGPPETLADLLGDIRTFYDDDVATDFAAQQPPETDGEANEAVRDDQECYEEWLTCIEEFCTVLEGYERAYDAACREQGVVSHADIAYWIAEYFDNPLEDIAGADESASEEYRARVKARYTAKFQSLLIDEAQDISIAQHDALAPFVTDETRVLMAGDVDQCIYVWRNARPEQFVTGFKRGEYFETEWTEHRSYSGSRTYRMRPDIAAAVDTIFGDVFTDPARGGGVDAVSANTDYSSLEPTRSGTADPAVHIAGYTQPEGAPGTPDWFKTEKTPVANYLAGGLTDGTFGHDTVTVLFATRSNMDELAEQLTNQGFSVVNASTHLFENPLIKLICRVVWWLVEPYDAERTRRLVESECLPLSSESTALFEDAGYQIDAVAERGDSDRQAATEDGFLAGLVALARRRARHTSDPGSLVAEEIIEMLGLRADPFGQVPDPERRLAACDALLYSIEDWEGDERYSLSELAQILNSYVAEPKDGLVHPVPNQDEYDIVFRTIHNMKGDEDSVVCLADASGSVNFRGPHTDTFLALGDTLALAPPETVSQTPLTQSDDQGPATTDYGSLRWASDYWSDGRIAGPPSLSRISQRYCAEQWRVLYVALTRARDHLVLSLPYERRDNGVETSWIATLADALSFEENSSAGIYEAPVSNAEKEAALTVGVNDVALPERKSSEGQQPTPRSAHVPAKTKTGWTSRYVNGTSVYQLTANAIGSKAQYILDERGESVSTRSESIDADLPDGIEREQLGEITHQVLTRAVSQNVSTASLRSFDRPLPEILAQSVTASDSRITPAMRTSIQTYLSDRICPQFATSDTWKEIQQAQTQYVEEPIHTVLEIDGIEIETQNRADIVSVQSDGQWVVDELKLTHSSIEQETRKQHRLQVAFYAWLLNQQLPTESSVTARLTYLGESAESAVVSSPIVPVPEWLAGLVDSE